MALASSLHTGQAPVCCNLCETETKIDWKCLPCNLLLCTKCKDKIHSKFKSADEHKIVNIKEVGLHREEIDFSQIKCQDHAGQICVMFCKSCDQIICTQCISKNHIGHGLVEISEGYQINVEKLKEGLIKAMANIDELTITEMKLDIMHMAEQKKFVDAKKKIQEQNEAFKKAVDELTTELDKTWATIHKSIEKEEDSVKQLKQNLNDQKMQTEYMINSNDAGKFFCESKQLIQDFNVIQPLDVKTNFNIQFPIFIPAEITEHNVGTLQKVSTDINMTISKTYTTDIGSVYDISSCSDGTLWIRDQDVTQKVETDNLKVMSRYNIATYGISLNPSNDLFLITKRASKLKQISDSTGRVTDSVYSIDPLIITAVHITSGYKILLGARTSGPKFTATERVVIRMNEEGKLEKTYEYNRNKQPIFTYVAHITTTTNGTIGMVDRLSEDNAGRVVVVGEDGDVLNTYTGHPKINDKTFHPVRVVTTPLDNIIVTELNIPILHILNSVGNLITYHNINTIGIRRPYALSFSRSGQLYIGCTTVLGSKKKAKLYEVDISFI